MSNSPSAMPAYAPPPPPLGYVSVAWSEAQRKRLADEHQQLLRAFAYHPFVAVSAVAGDPPTRYRVDIRVRTLLVDADGNLDYAEAAAIEIWMSPGFPNQPPLVRPLMPLFHPNVTAEAIALPGWEPHQTLSDVIGRTGDFLAWRSYDPNNIINDLAAGWLADNGALLPVDSNGDFTPNAGGEPLGRIELHGPQTIDRARDELDRTYVALEGDPGVAAIHLQGFSQRTRSAVRVLLAPDLPAKVREPAQQVDDEASALAATAPLWDAIRRVNTLSQQVRVASSNLTARCEPLQAELNSLAALVPEKFGRAAEAVRLLPESNQIEPYQLRLPELTRALDTLMQGTAAQLGQLEASQSLPAAPAEGGKIYVRLREQLDRASRRAQEAVANCREAIASAQSLLNRAKLELTCLSLIANWREYIDAFRSAAEIEHRLDKAGADALGGFFIRNSGGRFGPFQLEQEVDLGTVKVVVRTGADRELQLVNAESEQLLGKHADGKLTVKLPAGEGEPPVITQFVLAEGMEEPAVQLDYASRRTSEVMSHLKSVRPPATLESWSATMLRVMSEPQALEAAHVEHRKAVHRWTRILIDLRRLRDFKARLATYHLLTHAGLVLPRLLQTRSEHEQTLEQATKRLAGIAARGSRHPDSNELIIPPRFADAYAAEQRTIHRSQRDIARINQSIKGLAARVKARLSSPKLGGRPEVPDLRCLPPISADLAAFEAEMSDDTLRQMAESLSSLLKMPLPLNLKPAPASPTPARPVPPPLETGDEAAPSPEAEEADIPLAEAVDDSEGEELIPEAIPLEDPALEEAEPVSELDSHEHPGEPVSEEADAVVSRTPESSAGAIETSEEPSE